MGSMTTFQDKLLARTYCDDAGDHTVPNVLSPRDLDFRPDWRIKTSSQKTIIKGGWVVIWAPDHWDPVREINGLFVPPGKA